MHTNAHHFAFMHINAHHFFALVHSKWVALRQPTTDN
jgi:hypothetical protein